MIKFSLFPEGENLEVSLMGDLDIDGTEVIEELIPEMEKYMEINLNLSDVPFVDSSGMGLLLNLVQTLHVQGIKITISNVREDIMEVFEMLQLPDILGEGVFV